MTNLLEFRNKMKAKKPEFLRQDAHKIPRLKHKWKRPTGIHNKMRLNKKGHRTRPSVGYKSPKEVRNLTRTGLKQVIISNISQLNKIDYKKEAVLISRTVGKRNRVKILEKTKELNIKVLNIKDTDSYIKNIKEKFEKKKPQEVKTEQNKTEHKTEQKNETK